MEVLTLNHHPHSLRSSFHYSVTLSLSPFSSSSSSSSLFFNPHHSSSVTASSSDPDPKSLQSFNPLRKVPIFATLTAASTFFFLGFCPNGFINKSLSSVVSIQEPLDEKRNHDQDVEPVLHLKLKEGLTVVHDFKKTRIDYDDDGDDDDEEEAWRVLKGEVFNSNERLEFVKVGFEEMLEKDPKGFHNCVLEHLERVDECKTLLKEIKVAMDRCERNNINLKGSLRFFSKVVAHVRVLEASMFHALKYYKELDKQD